MTQQLDMEDWLIERSIHGWLGKMPASVCAAPPQIVKEWKRLSVRAKRVAEMPFSERKVTAAQAVEATRKSIIYQAEHYQKAKTT